MIHLKFEASLTNSQIKFDDRLMSDKELLTEISVNETDFVTCEYDEFDKSQCFHEHNHAALRHELKMSIVTGHCGCAV